MKLEPQTRMKTWTISNALFDWLLTRLLPFDESADRGMVMLAFSLLDFSIQRLHGTVVSVDSNYMKGHCMM